MPELAVVVRGGFPESRHRGTLVALDKQGAPVLTLGDPERVILPRSTVKPLQALACLRAGAPLVGEELAIAAGSHTGEDRHVAVVQRLLERAGCTTDDLRCPADWPEHEPTHEAMLAAGLSRSPERMNCSGKHAAMLLACAVNGWDIATYLDPSHPLQVLVARTLADLTGHEPQVTTTDGCGAPLFSVTVLGLARAFHRLAVAAPGSDEAAVADAMRTLPFFVGGAPHANSDVMRAVPGLLAKGGAEGVIGMATATGQAVALKVDDGSPRATTTIALAALASLGVDVGGADDLARVDVLGGGRPVGRIELGADLRAALARPVDGP